MISAPKSSLAIENGSANESYAREEDQMKAATNPNGVQKIGALAALKTKILVDGGDLLETMKIRELLGAVDGQTTNPSLIAKNPAIKERISRGSKLTEAEERDAYKNIVQSISPLVGSAGVSIEVFSDLNTTAEQMLGQGREMYAWIPNAYIKYPCTTEGLKAAQRSVKEQIRVNITLCFSQEQAAAVYAATKSATSPVYVSPFVGRLDDIGQNGVELLANIHRMFANSDGHVQILAASIRTVEQLLFCLHLPTELATVPAKVLEEWARRNFPLPGHDFSYTGAGRPIPYKELDLDRPFDAFNLNHELTTRGIQKFVADYEATLLTSH
jgi:transaldolase